MTTEELEIVNRLRTRRWETFLTQHGALAGFIVGVDNKGQMVVATSDDLNEEIVLSLVTKLKVQIEARQINRKNLPQN